MTWKPSDIPGIIATFQAEDCAAWEPGEIPKVTLTVHTTVPAAVPLEFLDVLSERVVDRNKLATVRISTSDELVAMHRAEAVLRASGLWVPAAGFRHSDQPWVVRLLFVEMVREYL